MSRYNKKTTIDYSKVNFEEAVSYLVSHEILGPLASRANFRRITSNNPCPANGYCLATQDGLVFCNPSKQFTVSEWVYSLSHALLHLGLGQIKPDPHPKEYSAAACITVIRLQQTLGLSISKFIGDETKIPTLRENKLYENFLKDGIPKDLSNFGTIPGGVDILCDAKYSRPVSLDSTYPDFIQIFAESLSNAAALAIQDAAVSTPTVLGRASNRTSQTSAQRAFAWFMRNYPLLGSLATTFTLIEDRPLCQSLGISVAAVDAPLKEIYINPMSQLTGEENRFVIAHELLHVALFHHSRRQGRNPFIWNLACDFAINAWLIEMQLGSLPSLGGLYDKTLNNLSAEEIYELLLKDRRRARRLRTLKGTNDCDILEQDPRWWDSSAGIDMDDLFKRCLADGLDYQKQTGRGTLPAGLLEEIRSQVIPPIPWDVELAYWFEQNFPQPEKKRTYARASRRQSSSPDIPRPRWYYPLQDAKTFGVILDTSGSMDRGLLAKALGAIISYSKMREVQEVRLVYCDAYPYDKGYVSPESLMDTVEVKGRGGTVLQPGIDLLLKSPDFPKIAPILIITDGYTDNFSCPREHAILLPANHNLPFIPKGKLFYIK